MKCPRCGSKMRPDISCHGSSLTRTSDHSRIEMGWICGPGGCGHWQDEVVVAMPGLPEPDRPFTKSDLFKKGIQGRKTTRQVVKEHLPAIKFWIFNQATLQECCDKLKAKGHNISAPSLSKHLRKIAAQEGK